jgi:small-conductance mechanosensitive channel
VREYGNYIIELLNYNLFALGNARITPLSILYLLLLTVVLLYISARLRDLLIARILTRTSMTLGLRQAIGTITRYVILFVGFIIILQTVGIDLTTLNVLAGAVGIGIGLGLQSIANNFISGLIVLLERPIQAGDRIDVKGVTGEVVLIGARATHVRTNDNITIIVPNSKLVSENLVNWTYQNQAVRFKIPIMVCHDADTRLVERLMCEAADENPDVEDDPKPAVRLMKWDEEGIYFELRAWSKALVHKPAVLKSSLNFTIAEKLRENQIRMSRNQTPFKQLHDLEEAPSYSNEQTGNSSRRKKRSAGNAETDDGEHGHDFH